MLIEAIVAISIGVVGLLGFLQLLTQAVSINKDVGQKFVAVYLAAEGIEIVKSLVDENYVNDRAWNAALDGGSYELAYDTVSASNFSTATGTTRSANSLFYHNTTGTYDYSYIAGDSRRTQFQRTIQITNMRGGQELRVDSIVEWRTRRGTEEVKLENHFFDWRL